MGYNYDSIALFLLYSALLGFALGFVYDFFRAIRLFATPVGKRFAEIVTFICDLLFFLVCTAVCAVFIFHTNAGRVRGIGLLMSLCGFLLYIKTVGRIILGFNCLVFRIVKKLLGFLFGVIIFGVLRIIWSFALKIFERCTKIFNYLFTKGEMFRIIKTIRKL